MDQQNEQEILVKKSPKKTILGVIGLLLAVVIVSLVLRFGIDSLRGGLFGNETKTAPDSYDNMLLGLINEKMKSEELRKLYTTNPEINEIMNRYASYDFTKPMSAYRLTMNEKILNEGFAGKIELSSFSEERQKYLKNNLTVSFFTQISSRYGTNQIVVSSIVASSVSYRCDSVKETECRLYRISDDLSVAIVVVPETEGVVRASATLVFLPIEKDTEAAVISAFEGFVSDAGKIG